MDINKPTVITEISRGPDNNSFSMDELFYRFFNELPLFYCQSGVSDIYDRPTVHGEDSSLGNPLRGEEELDKAIQKVTDFLKEQNLEREFTVARYLHFQANTFSAYLIFKSENILAQVRVIPGKHETLTFIYLMGSNETTNLWRALITHCKTYVEADPPKQDHIHIITMSDNDFYLKSIPLVNKHQQAFSYDFYNENFQAVSERVIQTLSANNESGLVLFHGDPGTGKTSYLKYLLHTITKKKLIYLPPDLIQSLSSPTFIAFIMSEASNSILLIEDAENVLRHREAGGNQAVSNILNISDGILGDVLRLQIVCTFNSRLDDIDQALLRPGRLISEYRFEKLSEDKTENLMRKLHGNDVFIPKAQMTLAEIFNSEKMPDKTKVEKPSFGFIDTDGR